ncbi:MAG: MFS transporter [Chloroflexi bacterium]|nr:MFS transporter [Chloroflexota bacterium]MBV9600971.1 MFS transporter [Chloroflexota bacterium]
MRSTVTLLLICASILGFVTALTMVAPLLLDLSRELDVPLAQAGLLAAVMSLPWALGAPFTGLLSDRLGRRPLIVLALAGVGASTIAAGFATSFAMLLVARFAAGMFGAFGPASVMAAVGDLFPPSRRGMAMGWLNAGFGLAAVAGVPAVGLIGGLWGWRWAFGVIGVVLLLLAALVRFAFPSPAPTRGGSSLRQTYTEVLGVPLLGNVLTANLLERAIFNATLLFLPSFLMLNYGLSTADVAPALALVAIGTLVGNSFGGWLGDRFRGPRAMIFVCAQLVAGGFGLVLFGVAPGLVFSVVLGALFGMSNASSRPSFLALGSELSPRYRGALLGLLSLTNQGGTVLGASLGGLAIGFGSYGTLALLTMCGGLGAASLALPLTRVKVAREA